MYFYTHTLTLFPQRFSSISRFRLYRTLTAFTLLLLLSLATSPAQAQRVNELPPVEGFTFDAASGDQIKYAVDGNNMARAVLDKTGGLGSKSVSLVKLEFFSLTDQGWKKDREFDLSAEAVYVIKDLDLSGRLLVLGAKTAGIGRDYAYVFRKDDEDNWKSAARLQTNLAGEISSATDVEILDTGNPATSLVAISQIYSVNVPQPGSFIAGVPGKAFGVVLFNFNSNWQPVAYENLGSVAQGGLRGLVFYRFPLNYGYRDVSFQMALSQNHLAVLYNKPAGAIGKSQAISILERADFGFSSSFGILVDGRYSLIRTAPYKLLEVSATDETKLREAVPLNGGEIRSGKKIEIIDDYLAFVYKTEGGQNYIQVAELDKLNDQTLFQNSFTEIEPDGESAGFGEHLDFAKTLDAESRPTYYLGVGAPLSSSVQGATNLGAIYQYSYTGTGKWGTTRPFSTFTQNSNNFRLGNFVGYSSSGLVAPYINNRAVYYDFLPNVPELSGYSNSPDQITLNVKESNSEDDLGGGVFDATAFSLLPREGLGFDPDNVTGSFDIERSTLGLGIDNYASFRVTANNAFGASRPLFVGGYFKGDGEISGRVESADGRGVEGVIVQSPVQDSYLAFSQNAPDPLPNPVEFSIQEFPDAFTVETWIRTTASSQGEYFLNYKSGTASESLLMGIETDANRPAVWINGNKLTFTDAADLSSASDTSWNHVALTRSGTNVQLYLNGEPAGSATMGNEEMPDVGTLVLGKADDSFGGDQTPEQLKARYFKGGMDELRIWKRARTAREIRNWYNTVVKDKGEREDLLLQYSFNEQQENIAAFFRVIYNEKANDGGSGPFYHGLLFSGTDAPEYRLTGGLDLLKSVLSDRNGLYNFSSLVPGNTYRLTPSTEGGTQGYEPAEQTIALTTSQAQVNNINFTDTTAFVVSGTIRFPYQNTTIPAKGITLVVEGSDGSTLLADSVVTDEDGSYVVGLKAGEYTITPRYQDHTFTPSSVTVSVPNDIATSFDFTNTTTRSIAGKFVGGSCEIDVGGATLDIVSLDAGIVLENITTRLQDGVHRFSVNDIPALVDDSLLVTITSLANDRLVLEKLVQGEGGFLDAEQPAYVDADDAEVNFFYRAPTEVSIVFPPSLEAIECYENTYLMQENQFASLKISAIETYEGVICQVDSAVVRIFDDISDRPDSLSYITSANFENFSYSLRAGNPNVVGGGDRPYQKALQIDVTAPGGPTVTNTIWAVVEGSTPRVGQPFVSTFPANVPLFILRDPPGDRSYSFIEQGNTFTRNLSISTGGSGSIGTKLTIGDPETTPYAKLGIETEFSGATSNSFNMSLTTRERIETSSEDGVMPGKPSDVFVGTNLNILYGLTDVLSFNPEICKATLTQDISWIPGEVESTYLYTYNEIQTVVIPELKETLSITDDPEQVASLETSIKDWEQLLEYDDFLHEEAVAVDPVEENRSFGAELGTYQSSTSFTTTSTDAYNFSSSFKFGLEIGVGVSIPIPFLGFVKITKTQFTTKFGVQSNQTGSSGNEDSFEVGYVLNDDDPGDLFSVNITKKMENRPLAGDELGRAGDVFQANTPLTNTTPFFDLIAGQSSAPWEGLPSVPRDSAQIIVTPRRQADVPVDGEAVFTLNVANLSQATTGNIRDIEVRVLPGSNPDGLIISTGSGNITSNAGILLEDVGPNDSRTITLTVKKGPLAYDYQDIAVVALSPYELAATLGNQRLSDTAFFSVSYVAPCEPVSVFRPEEGWVVNSTSNDSLRVIVDEYDKSAIQEVSLQLRSLPTGTWRTMRTLTGEALADKYTALYVDISSLADGSYAFRALTQCQGGQVYSDVFTGFIDRSAPVSLDAPLPEFGELSPEDVIALNFNEDIDPVTINTNNLILTNATTGDTLEVTLRNNERRIIMDFDASDPALENQLLQASARGIADKYGNVIAPIKWEFVVNRSPISWELPRIIEYMQVGENFAFDARIQNNGSQTIAFELAELPSWLEVITERTLLLAGESLFISFRVSNPAALTLGNVYEETISLNTALGNEPLDIILEVGCAAPDWTVDATAFTHSMKLQAGVYAEQFSVTGPNDLVAAYVGDELRGVAEVYKLVPDDEYAVYLDIYSNLLQGEEVSFKIWDASECEIMDVRETFTFEASTEIGSVTRLEPLSIGGINYLQIPLQAGVNWISFNVAQSDMSLNTLIRDVGLTDGSILSAHDGQYAEFASFEGWKGTLKEVKPGVLYKLTVPEVAFLKMSGKLAENQVNVSAGWNGIGLIKETPSPLAQALGSFTVSEGDIIRGQDASATYSGGAWQGSLQQLSPGEGYMFKSGSAGILEFARSNGHPLARTHETSQWSFNAADYEQYMTVTGVLELDGVEYHKDDAIIGAFVGDQNRGFAQPIKVLNRWMYFLTVYVNSIDDTLTFRMQRNGEEQLLEQTLAFQSEGAEGQLRSPFVFSQISEEVLRAQNFAPLSIQISDTTLLSDAASTTIGILLTQDPNPGDQHSYQLVEGEGGNDNSLFSIVNDELVNNQAITYQPGESNTYSIRVRATDNGGESIERVLTIKVTNASNSEPTAISLSSNSLLFDQDAGTLIGDLSVEDADAADVHSFSILSVNNDATSEIFRIENGQLLSNVVFTQDMMGSYELVVFVEDGNGGSLQQVLTVEVTDQVTSVNDTVQGELALGAFKPNPTRGNGSFTYYLPSPSKVTIRLSDMVGRVWQEIEKDQLPGSYQISLDLSNLPQGVYLYSIETEGEKSQMLTRRVIKY
ncbi:LamG-like jellyroll fold domain-containing protein [Catalinimonas sp. 4WD22]|uniref:LamG-like jellyroll fold domain-containing protein n=1 Tax=Catalinimonas locisalis TaxID=3133978 RepID=UPI00310195A1